MELWVCLNLRVDDAMCKRCKWYYGVCTEHDSILKCYANTRSGRTELNVYYNRADGEDRCPRIHDYPLVRRQS